MIKSKVAVSLVLTLALGIASFVFPLYAAQRTNQVASFANGIVRAEVDWNDSTGVLLRGRVINNSDQPAFLYVVLNPPIKGYSQVGVRAEAHQTVAVDWPNNVISYTWEVEDGVGGWKLYGVSIFCQFPADPQ